MAVRVITGVLAVALLGAWAPGAAATDRARKCTHGRLLVKVNKRSHCRRLRAVLPRPKRGDARLIFMRAALNLDVSKLKHRRGKHPRSLRHGFGRAGRKARKAFLHALPRALKRIDKLPPRATAARKGCGGPGSAEPVPGVGDAGDLSIQILRGRNGEEGALMKVKIDGLTFEYTFINCGNGIYFVPDCPAANGDVDSSSTTSFEVTTRVLERRRLISSQSVSTHVKDTLRGKVADDARLAYLDFKRVEDSLIIATGGVAERGEAIRVARVNMRTGAYDAANSSVTITGDAGAVRGDEFGAAVASAISDYRDAEVGGSFLHTDGWSTFDRKGRGGYCATAVFSPPSNTLRLRRNATGQLSVYAKASDGGKAAGARWTLQGQTNATFSPASAAAREPSVRYTVTTARAGGHIEVTVRFTSTAGVGVYTWRQATEDDAEPAYVGQVNATFSHDEDPEPGGCPPEHAGWNYGASLQDFSGGPFAIVLRPITGIEGGGAQAYGESGSGSYNLPACPEIETPGCSTGLEPIPGAEGQLLFYVEGATVKAQLVAAGFGPTTDACGGIGFGGQLEGSFPLSQVGAPTIAVHLSYHFDDGLFTRAGTGTLTLRRAG